MVISRELLRPTPGICMYTEALDTKDGHEVPEAVGRCGQEVVGRHHDVVQEDVGRGHAPEAHEALRRTKMHARCRARHIHRADALSWRTHASLLRAGLSALGRRPCRHACVRNRPAPLRQGRR